MLSACPYAKFWACNNINTHNPQVSVVLLKVEGNSTNIVDLLLHTKKEYYNLFKEKWKYPHEWHHTKNVKAWYIQDIWGKR